MSVLVLTINGFYFLIKFLCLFHSLACVFELIFFRCEFLQVFPINLFGFFSQRKLIQKLLQAPTKTVLLNHLFGKSRKIIIFFKSEHVNFKFLFYFNQKAFQTIARIWNDICLLWSLVFIYIYHEMDRLIKPVFIIGIQIDPSIRLAFEQFLHFWHAVSVSPSKTCERKLALGFVSVFADSKIDENVFVKSWTEHDVFWFDVPVQNGKRVHFL